MKDSILYIIVIILLLLVDYLITGFLFWVLIKALGLFGITMIFTWGKALGFWLIIKIAKITLSNSK